MFKLLIVDDEEIEREGMRNYIPWEKYGIEVVGTAWNGLDAYEQIISEKPDIVLTDISMPIMNGIELIKKTKESLFDVEFIVLSGYGEFEYTSKAMEFGVRYYILKPCDENKISEAIHKLINDIQIKKENERKEGSYKSIVRRLLPLAKSQIFRNLILGKEQINDDYELFMMEMGRKLPDILILGFRMENGFNYMEQFVLDNIIVELIGAESVLLSTNIKKDMLFLVDKNKSKTIDGVVKTGKEVFSKFKTHSNEAIFISVSDVGAWDEIAQLYEQVQKLLHLGSVNKKEEIQHYCDLLDAQKETILLFDYRKMSKAATYEEVIFEVYLLFLKMEVRRYTNLQKKEFSERLLKYYYQIDMNDIVQNYIKQKNTKQENINKNVLNVKDLIAIIVDSIFEYQCDKADIDEKLNMILFNIFTNLDNQQLSISFLCKEILYMNEDYFGRLFTKKHNQKFSDFLVEKKIEIAKELILFYPDIRISNLAEMLGFAPDGQYFSKSFKKITSCSPTEYRENVKNKK